MIYHTTSKQAMLSHKLTSVPNAGSPSLLTLILNIHQGSEVAEPMGVWKCFQESKAHLFMERMDNQKSMGLRDGNSRPCSLFLVPDW